MLNLSVALFFSAAAAQAAPFFVKAEADRAVYPVGGRAILFLETLRPPTGPDSELHLAARFENEDVNVVRVSPTLAVALPSRFAQAGTYRLELVTSQQNTAAQRVRETARLGFQKKAAELRAALARENDEDARELLRRAIAEAEWNEKKLLEQMDHERTLLEVGAVSLKVDLMRSRSAASATYAVVADRDPAVYAVGERATLFFTPRTGFGGPDGALENVFTGKLGAAWQAEALPSGAGYQLQTPAFTSAQAGAALLETSFQIRSAKQANRLRQAADGARRRIAELTLERSRATEETVRDYYDHQISALEDAAAALAEQLREIRLHVGTRSLPITITN